MRDVETDIFAVDVDLDPFSKRILGLRLGWMACSSNFEEQLMFKSWISNRRMNLKQLRKIEVHIKLMVPRTHKKTQLGNNHSEYR